MTKPKTKGVLTGVAGEYFVAAELTARGYIASITLKNTKGIDMLVSNHDASKSIGIQVKTNNNVKRKAWILNEKAERYYEANLFYVFVSLKNIGERPEYYIVPSKEVAEFVKKSHEDWKKTPGKRGQQHQETPVRLFKITDDIKENNWEAIENSLKVNS